MSNNVNFTVFSTVLSDCSDMGLSREAAEACSFSPELYARLFELLKPEQQQDFQTHFLLAQKHIIQLKSPGQNEKNTLHTLFMRHLLAIKSFHEFAPVADPKRLDELLLCIKPECRRKASKSLTILFSCCHTPQDLQLLDRYFENVPANVLPSYIEDLAIILPRVGKSDWRFIYLSLRADKIEGMSVLAKLVTACAMLAPKQIVELAKHVSEFRNKPEALEAAIPILSLCTTHLRIPDIVIIIAHTPAEDRLVFVEKVKTLVKTPTNGNKVYDILVNTAYPYLKIIDPSEREVMIDSKMLITQERMPEADFRLFVVNKNELSTKPAMVLKSFLKVVDQTDKITIAFPDERLSTNEAMRIFIQELAQALCRSVCQGTVLPNGLLYPEQAPLSCEQENALRNVGKLFMYCRTDIQCSHVIGKLLDMSVFIALKRLVPSLLKREITIETFELFYPIYKEMRGLEGGIVLNDDAKVALLEPMKKALVPCMAIRRGMTIPKTTTAEVLEQSIQGNETREQIFANILFGNEITSEAKSSIKSWIFKLAKNSSKMKRFLMTVTGSPILTPKPICITMQGSKLEISLNTQTIHLPERASIEDALKELDSVCFLHE